MSATVSSCGNDMRVSMVVAESIHQGLQHGDSQEKKVLLWGP